MFKKVAIRFVSTVGAAVVGGLAASSVFDISAWKTAGTAGVVTALPIIKRIFEAYRDGQFSSKDAENVFRDS